MPTYRIMIKGKEYEVVVLNPHERPVRTIVNGETIEVNVDDNTPMTHITDGRTNLPIDNGLTQPSQPQHITPPTTLRATESKQDVISPLPGIIVSISVSEGDRVESGQELCVLEAMKMNNPIRSTKSGRVKKIYAHIGQQVQHGIPLMTIEE